MRTLINLMLLCFLLLALAACGGKGIRHCVDADPADDVEPTCITVTGDAKADAFLARQDAAATARASQIAALADTSHCKDDRCVETAKALAALAFVAGGGNAQPQQYVPQPSTAARVGLALIGQLSPLASAAVAWRSSDNSVRSAEAQFGFLGGVVDSVSTASARSNEAAFGVLPQLGPRIGVGGDYVPGQIGDNAGHDIVRDGSQVGHNTGAINTGTQIENAGNLGDGNRQTSPDDNSQTTTCRGPGCQGDNRPITNPLPEPEPEDEG
jgi:predicted small lipoprotein YifL